MIRRGNRNTAVRSAAEKNGPAARRHRHSSTGWRIMMIVEIMVLSLFLCAAPAALAETSGTGDADTTGATAIETPEVDGSAGTDPAAVTGEQTGELGSIELILKYTDKSTNTEKTLNNGELSIYNVTDLKDWSQWTTAELEDKNPTLASDMLNNELKGTAALSKQTISNGKVKFTDLPRGMYLICQSELSDGELKILPFLMSIPDKNGNMNISAAPKPGIETPKTPDNPNNTPGKKTKLPQTGFVLWPVFVLIAAGLLLILIGTWLRRKNNPAARNAAVQSSRTGQSR